MRVTASAAIVVLAAGIPLSIGACFPDYEVGGTGGTDGATDSVIPGSDAPSKTSPTQDSAGDTTTRDSTTGTDSAADSGVDSTSPADSGTPPGDSGSTHFLCGPIGPSTTAISSSSNPATAIGDLVLICAYIEPANERTDAAVYGPFVPPTGFTQATWEPVSSNDAYLTSDKTNRQYVWWGYATTAGVQQYSVGGSTGQFYYADTAIITVKGYATAGPPFADTPSTGSYGNGTLVNSFPSVTVTPAASGTGFLWFGTSWNPNLYGYPSGYTSLMQYSTLSISAFDQGAAATQTVAPSVTQTNLLTASLMTFR